MVGWPGRARVLDHGPDAHPGIAVLMIAFLFFFYNAEIWQVMVALNWARTWAVVAIMAALAIVLVFITAHDDVHKVLDAANADGTRPGRMKSTSLAFASINRSLTSTFIRSSSSMARSRVARTSWGSSGSTNSR